MSEAAAGVWETLYTTRAMRRMRPDPVPLEVQARIMDAAVRAPSGGDTQAWRFLLVDDREVVGRLADPYREAVALLWRGHYAAQVAAAEADPEAPSSVRFCKLRASVQHLADHFEQVPLLFFAFSRGDRDGSSTYPAVWSAMLAARAQGVGSGMTNVLDVFRPDSTKAVLGVPPDRGWTLAATVAMGYPMGRWGVAPRRPAHEVTYRNRWGEPAGFETPEPLWSPGRTS
ncbi:nitroreductase family protein [Nocardioides deserti]|uniref:Nitroreductase family protein n=1 Tax=Nocardioides deserti TaxID=1588644 RepID=A0ABR6U7S2_9ACTN|nr:nitroreductase family protein [Nocardioides deserti]MBC2960418.1 nitroreductase family protein [Nocardioides deserti]GGO71445.1 nitroreductase [Nocardioides deserti]